jgi:hypothetical protein
VILRPFVVEFLTRNKKARYGMAGFLTLALIGVIAHDRLSTSERIAAEKTVDCPTLDQGCDITMRNLPYRIKTDTPIHAGIPFVLYIEGGGVEMRASWKIKGIDVEPNHYHMEADGPDRWKATMTLPRSPQLRYDWILHLEINARAVDVNTMAH